MDHKELKSKLKEYGKLFCGFFIMSLGIVMGIEAGLGVAPWDVFHIGLLNFIPLTLGQINIVLGLVIITISIFLGQYPGVGTVLNTIFIGIFMDLIQALHLIPVVQIWWQQWIMLAIGIYLYGWGSSIYISMALGCGPRDSLIIAIMKRNRRSIATVKTCIEIIVVIIGFLLGGPVGVGTILLATMVGVVMQHAFRIMGIDPAKVEHRSFSFFRKQTIKEI